MPGWSIFMHAVRMIINNFTDVMKIALVPIGISIVVGYLLLGQDLVLISQLDGMNESALEGLFMGEGVAAFWGKAGLYFIVYIVCVIWVIVNWHRFVLLEEYPTGWLPSLKADRILTYVGKSILLGLLAVLFFIPVAMVAGLAGAVAPALAVILFLVAGLFFIFVFYRLSVILPAAAVARPLGIREALDATKGSTKVIAGLLVCAILLGIASQIIIAIVSFLPGLIAFVISAFVQIIVTMIGVSIITSLYGIYVEGRQIEEG